MTFGKIHNSSIRSLAMSASALAIALLVGLAATPPATAPSTQPSLTAQDLQMLGQLETGSWRQRQSIQQQLVRRGVGDVPTVTAMLAHTHSPEARARLTAVLKQLADARQLGASLITMHFKNAPAKTVYASLFEQAFAPLKPSPANLLDSLPPLSIDADREPFWTVLQRLQKNDGLGIDRQDGACTLCRGATVAAGQQQLCGGFLVVITAIRPFIMGNANGRADKNVWLDLSIYPEPKLDILSIDPTVKIDHATDDHGNELIPRPEMGMPPQMNLPSGAHQLSFCMKAPEKNPGTRLVHFRATLGAEIALQWSRFDIDNLLTAKPKTIDVDGLALKFTGCKRVNGLNAYTVSFETPPDPKNQFGQFMQAGPTLRVLDADGHAMQCNMSSMSQNPAVGDTMAYTYMAGVGQPPARRLIWDIPTIVQSLDIPVDFKDLNLNLAGGK